MKKFTISLLGFIVFASLSYAILLFLHGFFSPAALRGNLFMYNRSHDYSKTRFAEAAKTSNVDLLILGSSHAYRGYHTGLLREKGIATLNLGTSAQSLIQTEYLLKRYFDQAKPKKVIIDIYPKILDSKGTESTIQLLSILPVDKGLTSMAFSFKDARVFNTLIFYTIKRAFGLASYKSLDVPSKYNTYVKGGYVSNNKKGVIKVGTEVELKFSERQKEALEGIIEYLKMKKVDYYLFQAPTTKALLSTFKGSKEIDKELATFGKYYNFNSNMILPDTLFMDDNHLNTNGALIYTEYVYNKLYGNVAPVAPIK